MTKGIAGLFKGRGGDAFRRHGPSPRPGSVTVQGSDGEQVLSAKHILLATGSVPVELSNLPFDGKTHNQFDRGPNLRKSA